MKRKIIIFLSLVIALASLLCACDITGKEPIASSSDTQSSKTPQSSDEPVIVKETHKTSFIGAGDNITYYGNWREAQYNSDGSRKYDFSQQYAKVSDIIRKYDLAFINQENVMTGGEPEAYPCFNCPREMADDLIGAGFNIINVANNHMLDQGSSGLYQTIDFWHTKDVTMIGGYYDEEDYNNIRVVEKNGIRTAFLSYTCSTNGLKPSSSVNILVPYFSEETAKAQVKKAREISDFVIVSVHWGDEYTYTPNDEQRHYANILAEAGADAIIGHHAHTIQPVEWIDGKDGGKTLCVYSLGNFISEQDRVCTIIGGMMGFDIVMTDGERAHIENAEYMPILIYFNNSFYKNSAVLLSDASSELVSSHGLLGYYGVHTSFDELITIAKTVIDKEFLSDFYK